MFPVFRRHRSDTKLLVYTHIFVHCPVHEFHISHWSPIATPETAFDDSHVSTMPSTVTRSQFSEQFRNTRTIPKSREGQPSIGHRIRFRPRDKGLHKPPQFLCFRQRRPDQLVLHERSRHVPEHRMIMGPASIQVPTGFSVSHRLRLASFPRLTTNKNYPKVTINGPCSARTTPAVANFQSAYQVKALSPPECP